MESPTTLVESLLESVETYAKTTYELSKLKTVERVSLVTTKLMAHLGIVFLMSVFVLILSMGVALLLGDVLGKAYYGFFAVAAFYLIASIAAHFFLHQWIKRPAGDLIIRQLLQ